MNINVKPKMLENIFFFIEVAFLLTTCSIALYNIYFDKNMIPLLIILAGYILSIKALRRLVANPEEAKKSKSKYIAFGYLVASTYGVVQASFLIFA